MGVLVPGMLRVPIKKSLYTTCVYIPKFIRLLLYTAILPWKHRIPSDLRSSVRSSSVSTSEGGQLGSFCLFVCEFCNFCVCVFLAKRAITWLSSLVFDLWHGVYFSGGDWGERPIASAQLGTNIKYGYPSSIYHICQWMRCNQLRLMLSSSTYLFTSTCNVAFAFGFLTAGASTPWSNF